MALLEVKKATIAIGSAELVHDVTLNAGRGELIGLVGPNGAGKTTLMRALAGLITHNGSISIDGARLDQLDDRERARQIGYLPQEATIHWPLSVREVILLGRIPHLGSLTQPGQSDHDSVSEAADLTGTTAYLDRRIDQLSAGERARVMLARMLATRAPLLLADEPVAALDPYYQLRVMDILKETAAAGAVVIIILHDLLLAAAHCSRTILLDHGRIAGDGPPEKVLTRAALKRTYHIAPGSGLAWPPGKAAMWTAAGDTA